MNLDRVLSEIDLEISRLQQAKQLLSENAGGSPVLKRKPGRPPAGTAKTATRSTTAAASPQKRTMSDEGRARIAAAQKARWAKTKKAAKTAAATAKTKSAGKKASAKKPGRPAGKTKAAVNTDTSSASAS